jgi:hypothetical protein
VLGGPRSVAESSHPSREVAAPYRVFSLEKLAPALLQRSPHAFRPFRLGYRVFTFQAPEETLNFLGILSWASAPLQRMPKHRAAALNLWFSRDPTPDLHQTPTSSASLEVLAPSASSRTEQRLILAGPASPDRLRLQVFSTSWRLHPLRACRPCFMPDPLLGSPSRAFLLRRSRTLFPAPFPSWRSDRLQGFAPRPSPPPGPVV